MKKGKKMAFILCCILLFMIGGIVVTVVIININSREEQNKIKNAKRYEEIKKDIDQELERYLYVIAPNCQKNDSGYLITHQTLVYNAGMDKEKFLDVDKESYCKAYVINECVEEGKWEWQTTISCQDYEEEGYVDWAEEFSNK